MQDLKYKNNVVEIISSYVPLKKSGKNYIGRCPFHSEKTPSFFVFPDTESFYCFGCGMGGDVISFIEKIENIDFSEAIKLLAERSGMEIPEHNDNNSLSALRKRILEINKITANYFYKCLFTKQGEKALSYLLNRGLTKETIKHFGLGYSPPDFYTTINYLKKLGYTDYELIQADIAIKTKNNKIIPKFIDRVIYPLVDLRGNVVGFSGRTMEVEHNGRKYVNTSDTPVFKKSNIIYGLNYAKNTKSKELIVVEGYMDVISLHQSGFENTIASMGTAFTIDQAKILSRYCEAVILCFDSDQAGEKATERSIQIMREVDIPIKILRIPGSKDPDEFIKSNGELGAVKFQKLIDECKSDLDFILYKAKKKYDIENSNNDKISYLNEVISIISGLKNPIEVDIYISKLSQETNVNKEALFQRLRIIQKNNYKSAKKQYNKEMQKYTDNFDVLETEHKKAEKYEQLIICYLYHNPDKYNKLIQMISPDNFLTDFNKSIYKKLVSLIAENASLDISALNQYFSKEEISKIVHIINMYVCNSEELRGYIDIINYESKKTKINSEKNIDDSDLLGFINYLKNNKK